MPSNLKRSADIIQPLIDVDFTLTALFSFTNSPSPYFHVVVVVVIVMEGRIIIVDSSIGIRTVDTRTIVVDTSISIIINTAVADASNSTIRASIVVVVGQR